MEHESNEILNLNIEDYKEGFEEVYKKSYIPKEYINDIKAANVLLVPSEHFRDKEGLFFPECTEEFYRYLKQKENEDLKVEIAVADEDFNQLELHADVINIVNIVLQDVVLPIVLSLIESYLLNKIKLQGKSPKDINTNVNLIVEKDGKKKKVTYNGSIENFEKAVKTVEDNLFK